MNIPELTRPDFQKLAVSLGKIARQHPEVGETDIDNILHSLIGRSLLALPLLTNDRPLLDIGSGVGIPGLVLALARPDLNIILLEPKTRCQGLIRWLLGRFSKIPNVELVESRLDNYSSFPSSPFQATSRAALGWPELFSQLPATSRPIIRWSSPDFNPANKRPQNYLLRVTVSHNQLKQIFTWSGGEKMFHVKQNEWRNSAKIKYSILSSPEK